MMKNDAITPENNNSKNPPQGFPRCGNARFMHRFEHGVNHKTAKKMLADLTKHKNCLSFQKPPEKNVASNEEDAFLAQIN
jgi:hypothetical protein